MKEKKKCKSFSINLLIGEYVFGKYWLFILIYNILCNTYTLTTTGGLDQVGGIQQKEECGFLEY